MPQKMNQKVKKLWVNALRSGKYKKCKDRMREAEGFCVLGVLCDIHSKKTHTKWEQPIHQYDDYRYLGNECNLPPKVIKWSGLSSADPYVTSMTALGLNDVSNCSFEDMADMIEENL